MAGKAGLMTFLRRTAPFVGLLCAMLTFAQSSKEGTASNSSQAQNPSTLSVDVDLVLLNATVTDPGNRYVTGLSQEHFQVWEDKIEQQISYFSTEEVPVSVGIIFDLSGSMEN